MSPYIDPTEQLVAEIVVRDAQRSAEFYRRLGFETVRNDGDFVIMAWEGHHLFLGALAAFHNHEVDRVAPPRRRPSPWPMCG
jgi:catechol 2,3-dioxygenase-like lactoylglutathione lyase family enzyme